MPQGISSSNIAGGGCLVYVFFAFFGTFACQAQHQPALKDSIEEIRILFQGKIGTVSCNSLPNGTCFLAKNKLHSILGTLELVPSSLLKSGVLSGTRSLEGDGLAEMKWQ
jgi:hypothetical protein